MPVQMTASFLRTADREPSHDSAKLFRLMQYMRIKHGRALVVISWLESCYLCTSSNSLGAAYTPLVGVSNLLLIPSRHRIRYSSLRRSLQRCEKNSSGRFAGQHQGYRHQILMLASPRCCKSRRPDNAVLYGLQPGEITISAPWTQIRKKATIFVTTYCST